jgi:hypothetical protein
VPAEPRTPKRRISHDSPSRDREQPQHADELDRKA